MCVRNDYVKKHSGTCMSCQKKGNSSARKHGKSKTRLHNIWIGLKQRRYGNGIYVCDEWGDFEVFEDWATNNGYMDHLTIDRIDNDGGYCPDNCQWITREENAKKDKEIFSDERKIRIYNTRRLLGITQREAANMLCVSRNTIQRAEKYAKQVMKDGKTN